MKISKLLILSCFISHLLWGQSDVNIDALIDQMSLEEKVGQMCQIDLGVVAKGDICALKTPQQIDTAKLTEAIRKYQVGSILNVGCGAGSITISGWHDILCTIEDVNAKYQKHHIPILFGIDAIHGAGYTQGSVLLPQQIAQAATWNPELISKGYKLTAYETRAAGIPWNFSPVLDIARQPLWSRFFETYGEDVYLARKMTTAAITGLQGEDLSSPYTVAACMKHFLGYSMPLSGKDRTPTWLGERALREYYLPTFQQAIKDGAATIMINSGEIDGIPVHDSYEILTTLLRDELGFDGVAVTDWEDIWKLVNVHRVAPNKKEAVRQAISAGIDMSMVPNDMEFCDLLVQLVREGSIAEDRIDLSVRRILTLKKKLGLFSDFTFPTAFYPKFSSAEHKKIAYDAASEAITLLKNKNKALPLRSKDRLFVCGPGAYSMNALNGPWSRTWQGVDEVYPSYLTTTLDALKGNFADVTYIPGTSWDSVVNIAACKTAAAGADKIIICLAEKPSTELPGNILSLELPSAQKELVDELSSLGKPIILVCNFNRPRIIHDEVEKADAVLYAYYPGDLGGQAIADVIVGKVNPSGKLPFTYPPASGSIVHYDRKHTEDMHTDFTENAYHPEFDFGFGLSYTDFEYSKLEAKKRTLRPDDTLELQVEVKNTGDKAGHEVIQIYYSDLFASVTPSVKKLCAFKKVYLPVGESKTIHFEIPMKDLSLIDKSLKRTVEKGEFEIMVSTLKTRIDVI